jgi:hypothetical protein
VAPDPDTVFAAVEATLARGYAPVLVDWPEGIWSHWKELGQGNVVKGPYDTCPDIFALSRFSCKVPTDEVTFAYHDWNKCLGHVPLSQLRTDSTLRRRFFRLSPLTRKVVRWFTSPLAGSLWAVRVGVSSNVGQTAFLDLVQRTARALPATDAVYAHAPALKCFLPPSPPSRITRSTWPKYALWMRRSVTFLYTAPLPLDKNLHESIDKKCMDLLHASLPPRWALYYSSGTEWIGMEVTGNYRHPWVVFCQVIPPTATDDLDSALTFRAIEVPGAASPCRCGAPLDWVQFTCDGLFGHWVARAASEPEPEPAVVSWENLLAAIDTLAPMFEQWREFWSPPMYKCRGEGEGVAR